MLTQKERRKNRSQIETDLRDHVAGVVRKEISRRRMTSTEASRKWQYKPRQFKLFAWGEFESISLTVALNFAECLGVHDSAMKTYVANRYPDYVRNPRLTGTA